MNRRGHYRMHRGWMENPILAGEPFTRAQAWCWLIEQAAWRTETRAVGGKGMVVERGQLPGSLRTLADAWKWPKTNVSRFLAALAEEGMIRMSQAEKAAPTIVEVVNYDTYQGDEWDTKRDTSTQGVVRVSGDQRDSTRDTCGTPNGTASGTPQAEEIRQTAGNRGTASGAPSGTRIEEKKKDSIAQQGLDLGANDPDGVHFDRFWQACPRKVGKGQAKPAFAKALRKTPASTIIAAMASFASRMREQGTEERFIPHPTTWLNGERWIEERQDIDPAGTPATTRRDDRQRQEQFTREYEQAKAEGDDALRAFFAKWKGQGTDD